MARTYKVAVLVGSLRKQSVNRKAALALAELAPPTLELEDRRDRRAAALRRGYRGRRCAGGLDPLPRRKIAAADAVLFVTPEYNRSVPAALKNAIDVGSRPYGKQRLAEKAGCGDERFARRDRRLRRQPPSAPVAGVPRHAGAAAARGLHRRRRHAVRRGRRHRGGGQREIFSRPSSMRSRAGST